MATETKKEAVPAGHELVLVQFDRPGYTRAGVAYDAGDSLEVPKFALETITNANPPYGHVVTDAELDAVTAPAPSAAATPAKAVPAATPAKP